MQFNNFLLNNKAMVAGPIIQAIVITEPTISKAITAVIEIKVIKR